MENLRPPSGKTGLDCHVQGSYFSYPGDLESLGKEYVNASYYQVLVYIYIYTSYMYVFTYTVMYIVTASSLSIHIGKSIV